MHDTHISKIDNNFIYHDGSIEKMTRGSHDNRHMRSGIPPPPVPDVRHIIISLSPHGCIFVANQVPLGQLAATRKWRIGCNISVGDTPDNR